LVALVAQLALLLGVAEAAAAPARLEQPEQLGQRARHRAAGVEALEHLVDEDPKRWLSVGSLGIRKTRANLYFSGHVRYVSMSDAGEHQPVAAAGEERLERRLGARRDRPRAQPLVALGVEQVLVERRRLEDLALLGGRGLQQPRVDLGSASATDMRAAGPCALEQRRELDQLEVAHDGVGDVEVGVEAQLPEPAADLGDGGEQLVAQEPEGRLQRLGRARRAPRASPPTRRRPPRAPPPRTGGGLAAPRSVLSG
jgi:hypothetical protein